ncbi:hypothetical protein IJU85_03500 [Candidatus Saccharibacteria bacterium]|nr:hypothetical protein [Candidatus Saccharibacteria bacterium]
MVIHKESSSAILIATFLSALTCLSITTLMLPSVYAEDIIDEINISIPVACSIYATGMGSHTATINNGQTTSDIGTTNIKVICNDNSGYAIYAIGYTDDTYGKTVLTSSTLGSTHDIITSSTVTTGTSSWAMKLTAVSGTYTPIIAGSTGDNLKATGDPDFSDYTAVPEEYTKVAYHTSSTDTGTNATGSTLTTTYRAYISPTQPAGTYIGQVKYTLVHPNTAAAPSTMLIMQDVANWKNSLAPGQEIQIKDSRDNKVYYAAKLADGNIWMTQNLDHDIGDITGGTYTSADTDLPANSQWTPSVAEQTYATSNTTWNGSYIAPESYDPGDLCWTGNLNTDWDGTLATETESCTQDGNHYHIGNYYNWTAAVAMSNSSSYTIIDTDVNQSICPAGWMLPKSGWTLTGSGSFVNLVTEYDWDDNDYMFTGSYTAWGEPLRLALDGYWDGDSSYVAGSGLFWSSVDADGTRPYSLYIDAGGYTDPQLNDEGRSRGYSVRCVTR